MGVGASLRSMTIFCELLMPSTAIVRSTYMVSPDVTVTEDLHWR